MLVTVDLPDAALKEIAENHSTTPEKVAERIQSMYESNLYEDLKWVDFDIFECGI
jgi:hypothetical protein